MNPQLLYQHRGVALLRAAAAPLSQLRDLWPDLSDAESCREWLRGVWANSAFVEAVRQASPGFAGRV